MFDLRKIALAFCCACFVSGAALASDTITGHYALQGGLAKTKAYLSATPASGDPLAFDFNLWFTPLDSSVAITSYDVEMTKMLHAVIVSDDFRTFLHEHPTLEPSGHFVLDERLPRATLYHVFADAKPSGLGQQVFRFDVQAGSPVPADPAARDLSERAATYVADGYAVTLSTLKLHVNGESTIDVHIRRDGKPAADLHPYLGALAHAVFINAEDLSYVHAHPVPFGSADEDEMGAMKAMKGMSTAPGSPSAPDMTLHVRVVTAGTYKLWFQFAGGGGLHVAQFVLTAG